MATLVLSAGGQALGGIFGPVGAVLGKTAGAIAGSLFDQTLFGSARSSPTGRLASLQVQTASEGNPVARVYGRVRLTGTIIWATNFEEEVDSSGGDWKSGSGSTRQYRYFANFAVGLCEGPISHVGRVWADGKLLDLTGLEVRIHSGDEQQAPDPLITAKQKACPAYRGLAYVVFERLPIEPFGNRIPQLTFEVIRSLEPLEQSMRAVTVIPGATEFGYQTVHVKRVLGPGWTVTDNRQLGVGATDFDASIDELVALCPNLERVALVVAWFGTDLRAGQCRIEPRVERADRMTLGDKWEVAGLTRAAANSVSAPGGAPGYGGTPSDSAVVAAIRSLKERGLKVTLCPMILMDVAPGNGLPDPYGATEQPAFPWRGRITVDPAPGTAGSADRTQAAADQVTAYVGAALPAAFTVEGAAVEFSGTEEWSHRRMILHYAMLAEAAGGVDAFLIGSEMVGLTRVRDVTGAYPFVEALATLAADVKGLLGSGTKVSYAADWSEYHSHRPSDGTGDVIFNLDPLWSSSNVDFIGIDNYLPLSDWRDGTSHLDYEPRRGHTTIYELDYLTSNVEGGEYYDWYYRSDSDRDAQVRTPIADTLYGEPWVWGNKRIREWWSSPHYSRSSGIRQNLVTDGATPSTWSVMGATTTPATGPVLGVFESPVTVASGGLAGNGIQSSPFAAVGGATYHVRIWYQAGTSGFCVLILLHDAGNVWVEGPVGALFCAAQAPHVVSSVTNIDHGGGLYEARFDIVFASSDSTVYPRIGPYTLTAGADVGVVALEVLQDSVSSTAWKPCSKPIWFTELGCPAVDRGSNQPNVFYDPKSSESALPYYSDGGRDDAIQRQYLTAMLQHFGSGDVSANPVSPVYGGPMVDMSGVHLWTWDARPWPAFPFRTEVWADGPNWQRGHWLTGRLGGITLGGLIETLHTDFGFARPTVSGLTRGLDGYLAAGPSTLRELIEPLADAFSFVVADTGTDLAFLSKTGRPVASLGADRLVDLGADAPVVRRAFDDAGSLPSEQRIEYLDSGRDFAAATARATRSTVTSRAVDTVSLPAVLPDSVAGQLADIRLSDRWVGRETLRISLPPSLLTLLPGDVVDVSLGETGGAFVVEEVEEGPWRNLVLRRVDQRAFRTAPAETTGIGGAAPSAWGPPTVDVLDLPTLSDTDLGMGVYVAATCDPWPGSLAVWSSASGAAFDPIARIERPSTLGKVITPPVGLYPGRWDRGSVLDVQLYRGTLSGRDPLDVLDGRNLAAIQTSDGGWELLQFSSVELVAAETYRLTDLLRGQGGTEDHAASGIEVGAPFVLVDANPSTLPVRRDQLLRELCYRIGPATRPVDDEAVLALTHTASGQALRPLSPAHVDARRNAADGSIVVSWIRRTRIGGDDWSGEDVPLGEETELYRVEILAAGGVLRTATVAGPRYVYALSDQQTDFRAPPSVLQVRVAQLAAGFGAGAPSEVLLNVR